jgi:hypothetical protein
MQLFLYIGFDTGYLPNKVEALSEATRIPPEKVKEVQERTRERNLILREMKNHSSLTIDELSKATGIEKSRLLKHIIAMRQFGKVLIVGEQDNQLLYSLPKEN